MSKAPKPAKEGAAPEAASVEADVEFVSTGEEPYGFEINFVPGYVREDGKAVWKVPASDAHNFSLHWHIVSGRVERA